MLACDRFLFVHLHKSGGTFVNALMLRCIPGAARVGYHLPYSQAPEALRGLPVLGTLRDPLGYYVSWYHFQAGLAKPNALFRVCSRDGALGFAGTVDNLVHLAGRLELVAAFVEACPDGFVGHGLNLTKACVRPILEEPELGFYSFLFRRMYRGAKDPTILPAERLRSSLSGYLARMKVPQEALWTAFLEGAPDMNTSRHGDPLDYYDENLLRAVRRRDAELFARR